MTKFLKDFDPIEMVDPSNLSFFTPEDVEKLRQVLTNKISDYVIIKMSPDLTEEQLEKVLDGLGAEERIKRLKKYIEEPDDKIAREIERFKVEFKTASY